LTGLLAQSASRHSHLCPRQVLGVRIGLAGAGLLNLEAPRGDKRLLVIAESDGCFADGLEVAAGVSVGHRTLRLEDYGKIAATFVDTHTGLAFRLAPRLDVRQRAWGYAPAGETRRYFAQLMAYQAMPLEELVSVQPVALNTPIAQLLSRPGVRANCAVCGEEIINERQVLLDGQPFCRACAGQAYYRQSAALPAPVHLFQALPEAVPAA
jgi:formylmethanofuran dehydrogenase subunit E